VAGGGKCSVGGFADELHGARAEPPQGLKRYRSEHILGAGVVPIPGAGVVRIPRAGVVRVVVTALVSVPKSGCVARGVGRGKKV
jgi:hypothetical protein